MCLVAASEGGNKECDFYTVEVGVGDWHELPMGMAPRGGSL